MQVASNDRKVGVDVTKPSGVDLAERLFMLRREGNF
jgi:hypothetical protein